MNPEQNPATAPLPPGPSPLATTYWMQRMRRNVCGAFDELAGRYGDVVALRTPFQRICVVRGAEATHRVLVANQDNYAKSHQYDLFGPALGQGLVTSSGDVWRRSRRMVQPLFAKRYLPVYADHMSAAAGAALDAWDELPDGRPIQLDSEILHVGLDTVGRALASKNLTDDAKLFELAISGALHEIGVMSKTPAALTFQDVEQVGIVKAAKLNAPRHWQRYLEHMESADAVITALVDERIEHGHGDRDDLLRLLMETVDDESGETLSRQQVIDEMKTILAAGHETTAHGLTWMFLLLSENPDALAKLHEEVDTVLEGRPPTAADADELPWLAACFQEAMRLIPPVWHIPRLATEDDVLGGYRIPAGTRVLVSVWSTHRDPAVYDDPTAFRPERWLGDAAKERPRFSYLPFGGGRRACVGQGFAILNAQILGAMLAQRYSFEPDRTKPIKLEFTITTRPQGGVPAFAHRRAPVRQGVAA